MPFVENRGVRLHWQEAGSGTPIVLVMGHRFSSALWYPILPALTAEHRVIWFDNRGTGLSGMTRQVSIADLVDDTLAVMDAAEVARAHVFGVSMGGGIVLELAIRHPESRWIVLASTPVASVMRLAARPVGAQSNSRTPLAARILRIELTIVVLPTPGPPVTTSAFAISARRIAAL